MLIGMIPEEEKMTVVLKAEKPLIATINPRPQLEGKMIVSTRDVPIFETTNPSGGETVYIAREVLDNGSE